MTGGPIQPLCNQLSTSAGPAHTQPPTVSRYTWAWPLAFALMLPSATFSYDSAFHILQALAQNCIHGKALLIPLLSGINNHLLLCVVTSPPQSTSSKRTGISVLFTAEYSVPRTAPCKQQVFDIYVERVALNDAFYPEECSYKIHK